MRSFSCVVKEIEVLPSITKLASGQIKSGSQVFWMLLYHSSGRVCALDRQTLVRGLTGSVWTSQEASDLCPKFANHAQFTLLLEEWTAGLLAVFLCCVSMYRGCWEKLAPFPYFRRGDNCCHCLGDARGLAIKCVATEALARIF